MRGLTLYQIRRGATLIFFRALCLSRPSRVVGAAARAKQYRSGRTLLPGTARRGGPPSFLHFPSKVNIKPSPADAVQASNVTNISEIEDMQGKEIKKRSAIEMLRN